ncbi:UNVERIFIED_CONTAM: hypothetical protein Slati_1786100 [Sesamum latifolium]|uniref:Uncharacterized protein n=1 Tax=Sesamum latifolium TaxID=2727402 RepID=A0AAW2X1R9_9LAMI
MTTILAGHPPTRLPAVGESFSILHRWTDGRILCFGYSNQDSHVRTIVSGGPKRRRIRSSWALFSGKLDDGVEGDDDSGTMSSGKILRRAELALEKLEKIVGVDDSSFSGIDLATLIRNKYGRSYDVQLIKKEFMGRNLLALNVMWKYMEQRSFPLTEEEYILRLDDVANTLKCWGAVSHIRNSLEKLKERPRIGKAVSIFIDMDESGGRANEWIYK